MNWEEVCSEPLLQDLPYKIELNEWGQIVLTPASNKHGFFQSEIVKKLATLTSSGKTISECSIDTSKGTKVADVVWFSDDFYRANGLETPYSISPEICVEIISPSNSTEEMEEKRRLYFDKGAKEVWICDEEGKIDFYSPEGKLSGSRVVSAFPGNIEL